jgi:Tol biopolymer transport system component
MRDGHHIGELENFRVTKDGDVEDSVDRNFWGVTFAPDSDTFYATLGTGGDTYLIKGSVSKKRAKVIYDGVECPSVSPDGTKIAYKKSTSGSLDTPTWRLHVLDLATMKSRALNETHTVDDQVEWIDDSHIAYARLTSPNEVQQTNVWEVPVEGKGKPRRLVLLAGSPSVS